MMMKNKRGYEYKWERVSDNTYSFIINEDAMEDCKIGGFENQQMIDMKNLSFFEPKGGPLVEVNGQLEGKSIRKIYVGDFGGIYVEVV